MGRRTYLLSDLWAVRTTGRRINGPSGQLVVEPVGPMSTSDQWAVGSIGCRITGSSNQRVGKIWFV